jgi:hypothetical protein
LDASGLPDRSFAPVVIVAVYRVFPARATEGVKVANVPDKLTLPDTAADPCFRVNVDELIVVASIASLNVAVAFVLTVTDAAFDKGTTDTIVGGVISAMAAVVKLQV